MRGHFRKRRILKDCDCQPIGMVAGHASVTQTIAGSNGRTPAPRDDPAGLRRERVRHAGQAPAMGPPMTLV